MVSQCYRTKPEIQGIPNTTELNQKSRVSPYSSTKPEIQGIPITIELNQKSRITQIL